MPQISPMKWIFLALLNQTVIFQSFIISSSSPMGKALSKKPSFMKTNKIFWKW